MMGRQRGDQSQLFYLFNLESRIPERHLLRRLNPIVTRVLTDLRSKLEPFYSDIGRPSIDPELMIRMLIVGYCYGVRFEKKLCEEVELHLAYRWFCRLDLDDRVPDHSTFSVNRHGRFRDGDILRQVFESVVRACMRGSSRVRASRSMPASLRPTPAAITASRRMKPTGRCRSVRPEPSKSTSPEPNPNRKPPKVISLSDPASAWTAKANKRVQFGYGLNYMIDVENAVIVDVEATPARTYDEVKCTEAMIARTERTFGLKPDRLMADTAYGTGKFLRFVVDAGIAPYIPVWDKIARNDGTFSRADFAFDKEKNIYTCPAGKTLTTTGHVSSDHAFRYLASIRDCKACPLKAKCCANMPHRRIMHDVNEDARDVARSLMGTPDYERSRDKRKKVEMKFATTALNDFV
jgi:transposase